MMLSIFYSKLYNILNFGTFHMHAHIHTCLFMFPITLPTFNTGHNVSMATKIRLTEYHAKACNIQQIQKHEKKSEQAVPYPNAVP